LPHIPALPVGSLPVFGVSFRPFACQGSSDRGAEADKIYLKKIMKKAAEMSIIQPKIEEGQK